MAAALATVNLEFSIADLAFSENLQFRGLTLRCETIELSADSAECKQATLGIAHSPFGAVSLRAELSWTGREQYGISAGGRIGNSSRIELVVDADKGGRR
ncbi:MAG: hypothetical protein ACU85U_20670, partial [Gammaproteobacteria bacterium]